MLQLFTCEILHWFLLIKTLLVLMCVFVFEHSVVLRYS